MKTTNLAIVFGGCLAVTVLFFGARAHAGEEGTGHYYGHIVSVSPSILVKPEAGPVFKLSISDKNINDASLDMEYNRIQLHKYAKTSSCTKLLGRLASDLTVTIGAETNEGKVFAEKAVLITPSGGSLGEVKVLGSCNETTNEPSQLWIETEKGDIEI